MKQKQSTVNVIDRWGGMFSLSGLLGMIICLTSFTQAQVVWTKHPNNPVLSPGTGGTWDDNYLLEPWVLYDGTTYKMWYEGHDGQDSRIGYAISDDGAVWTKVDSVSPVLDLGPSGSWDDTRVGLPSVQYDGTIYRMWYRGYDGTTGRIGYATSPDGVAWTKDSLNPVLGLGPSGSWDDRHVRTPVVLMLDDTTFFMWYNGSLPGPSSRIGLATSKDGVGWDKWDTNPVMDIGTGWESVAIFPESVILIDDTLRMWYLGINPGGFFVRSGYATSSDGGVEWTKYDGNPVLHVGEAGAWDDVTAAVGAVLFHGTTYEMWYDSWDGASSSIGYATSLHGLLEVTVSPTTYVVPGTDSVVVTALFTSDTTGLGLFAEFEASDHTTLDSVRLYDDGAHHDGAADDNLFGNVWPVPPDERLYNIGLKATLNDTEIINYDDLARFTTIGPLEYADDSLASRSTETDKTYNPRIYLRLRNAGSMATATGITALLSTLDTCVTAISSNLADFGDIPAGGSVMSFGSLSSGYFQVSLNQNCPIGTEIPYALSISSDGYAFWSDTITVPITTATTVGIADAGGVLPSEFALHQNYPNPFNPVSTLRFDLPQGSEVSLIVYDIRGRELTRLIDSYIEPGSHQVKWEGGEFPSGIYIARLVTPEYTKSIKMVLLK